MNEKIVYFSRKGGSKIISRPWKARVQDDEIDAFTGKLAMSKLFNGKGQIYKDWYRRKRHSPHRYQDYIIEVLRKVLYSCVGMTYEQIHAKLEKKLAEFKHTRIAGWGWGKYTTIKGFMEDFVLMPDINNQYEWARYKRLSLEEIKKTKRTYAEYLFVDNKLVKLRPNSTLSNKSREKDAVTKHQRNKQKKAWKIEKAKKSQEVYEKFRQLTKQQIEERSTEIRQKAEARAAESYNRRNRFEMIRGVLRPIGFEYHSVQIIGKSKIIRKTSHRRKERGGGVHYNYRTRPEKHGITVKVPVFERICVKYRLGWSAHLKKKKVEQWIRAKGWYLHHPPKGTGYYRVEGYNSLSSC